MLKCIKKKARFLVFLLSFFVLIIFLYVFILYSMKKSIYINIYHNAYRDLLKANREITNLEEMNSLKLGDVYYFRLNNFEEITNESINKNTVEEVVNTENIEKINMYKSNKWRIKIPILKIDAPIAEGTSQEAMRRTVGHFETSSKWEGNVALAAHNRGYRCNFFQEIKKLQKGDEIIYCTEQGEKTYEVILNEVIKETDWSYVGETEDNRITLITCEENKREYRRCIQAVEVQK